LTPPGKEAKLRVVGSHRQRGLGRVLVGMSARTLLVAIVLALALGIAHAQDDPLRALVGTWQGQVDVRRDPERTLVIKSVSRRDGQWVADIHYGTTGKGLSHLQAQIEMSGGAPTLFFTTSADIKAELKLFSERELRGFLKIRAEAGSWVGRKMRLEKTSDKP